MTTERRWYEPPAPRDWHPSPSDLQRLESASSFRKALLDRSPTKGLDRASLRSSSSEKSDAFGLDKSLMDKSFRGSVSSRVPSSSGALRSHLRKADGASRPGLPARRTAPSSPVTDLSATYVFKNFKDQTDVEKILEATPPSRVRSSSITRYEPLPAINSSSTNQAVTMDTNNNKHPEFEPPPLIRSRTFDVIDTQLKELPVIDDSLNMEVWSPGPTHTVTISIEGKPLAEFLSHARDGLLKSRPCTRYGRSDSVEASIYQQLRPDVNYDFNKLLGIPKEEEHEPGKDSDLSEGDTDSDDSEGSRVGSCAGNEFETGSDSDLTERAESSPPGESEESDMKPARSSSDPEAHQPPDEGSSDLTDPSGGSTPGSGDDGEEEESGADINVYFRLPDDSLLLVASPRSQTLEELLQVVGNTRVGERRLAVAQEDLDPSDLTKTLAELGLTDNTTLYLLSE